MKKIVVVCGPTGIGKTGLAISLARRFNAEIVGADSMQIYRYMDIGTAKPDRIERSMAVHHLVDVLDPADTIDAARFAAMADQAIEEIHGRKKLAIVAGGTGLYIRALLYGLFRSGPADPSVLESLEALLKEKGSLFLHKVLVQQDPVAAAAIHPNDGFRIIRALEVQKTTGCEISRLQEDHGFSRLRYSALLLGLTMDRERLYDRINRRVDQMLENGLLEEVRGLISRGYPCTLKTMQSIGYRHLCDYLSGSVDWGETVRLLKRDTRRYAKRQLTWFRKEPGMTWIEPDQVEDAVHLVRRFLGAG